MEVAPNFSEKAKRDIDLIHRAKSGDQKAFADLLGHYRDSIYFLLLKMVNNKSDAEDLTIEAFGKAFRNLDQYSPDFAFSTWLFKIASNNGIDFLRSKKTKRYTVSIDNSPDDDKPAARIDLKANSPDPEEHLIIKQKENLMQAVIKKLNPNYRKIVELRYFKELSYLEIADELDLPVGTVKARLHRARELLLNTMRTYREGKELEDK